ncbi:MAG: hypothetical protein AABZ60_10075 [Planctomycetota bacterium]
MLTKRSSIVLHPFWIFFFTILAYTNTLRNSFLLWDDNWLIYQNRWVTSRSFSCILLIFNPGTNRTELGSEYLPFPQFFYWLEYFFWENNPIGYHLTQILVYSLSCQLLYYLFRTFTSPSIAFWTSILFALHPIHTESVTWLSGQKDIWALFFFLLTCLAHQKKYFKLAQMGLVLALLSKGTAVILIGCLFLLDKLQHASVSKNWKHYLRYGIFTGLLLALHLWTASHHGNIQENPPTFQETVASFGISSLLYLKLLCIPTPLLAHYELCSIPPSYGIGIALVLGVGSLGYALFRLYSRLLTPSSFFWLWFWGTLLPVSNLIFYRTSAFFAERYLLFPSIAFCYMLATFLTLYSPKLRWFVLICFLLLTIERNQDWQDTERLWKQNLTISPKNATVWGNLGMYYQELLPYEKNLVLANQYLRQSEICYQECLKFQPQHIRTIHNLGLLELERIRLNSDALPREVHLQKAHDFFLQALKINPEMTQALSSLGGIAFQVGDLSSAKQYYLRALACDSAHFVSLVGMGNILLSEKNYPQSEFFYQKAFEDRPQEWILKHYCLGLLYTEWAKRDIQYWSLAEQNLLKVQKIHPKAEQELARLYKIKNNK